MPKLAFRDTLPRPDDPGIISRVCEAVRKGHSIRATAALAGISRATLMDWLTTGRREMDDAHHTGTELGTHGLFAAQVERAYAELEAEKLGRIDEAGKKPHYWAANMAVLRSRNPEEWVENRELHIKQESVNVNITAELPEGDRRRLLDLLGEQRRLPAPEEADTT